MTVTGVSEYRGVDGQSRDQMNFGPETQTITDGLLEAEFRVDPNTNYTVRVSLSGRDGGRGRGEWTGYS